MNGRVFFRAILAGALLLLTAGPRLGMSGRARDYKGLIAVRLGRRARAGRRHASDMHCALSCRRPACSVFTTECLSPADDDCQAIEDVAGRRDEAQVAVVDVVV